MDRAISEPVDLVISGGDAFPGFDASTVCQEAFARQFSRLVDVPDGFAGRKSQYPPGQGGASQNLPTLGIPKFIVGDRLDTHLIQTRKDRYRW